MPKDFHIPQFAGIHLAGVNSHRTAVVSLSGHPLKKSLKLTGLYEKIGHFGNQFSDDRLLEILRFHSPFDKVFIDSPIAVPPCVSCVRPVCPGVDACEDVSVAYMMALANNLSSKQRRRRRSLNPQVQRLWDVYRLSKGDPEHFEPTYTSNNANHAIRARSLQKRLAGLLPDLALQETSITLSLVNLSDLLAMGEQELRAYRSFSSGFAIRQAIVSKLVEDHWIEELTEEKVWTSVDVFEAFVAAFVAAMVYSGLEDPCPGDYAEKSEWVHRPQTIMEIKSE